MTPNRDPLREANRRAVVRALETARATALPWAEVSVKERLRIVRAARHRIGDRPEALAATVNVPWRASSAETLTAEVLPLLEAIRFLEREAPALLAPRKLGRRGRPAWLSGSGLELRREPFGVILILGPANYPILLAGVQALQALVAGNAVVIKPGVGGQPAMERLARELEAAGLPSGVLHVLSESVEDARQALRSGVDKVVLTGGVETGRRVLLDLAESLTPSVMELSGCDAAWVGEGADLDLAARAIAFGMTWNGGFTCIAPRRIVVVESVAQDFEKRLVKALSERGSVPVPEEAKGWLGSMLTTAEDRGARLLAGGPPENGQCPPILISGASPEVVFSLADLPAPVAVYETVPDLEEALEHLEDMPYRLGLSIFERPAVAQALARRAAVGVVVINDMIVPTADPRLPFGGGGASGFGRTRGASGLLELTSEKAVVVRRGRFRPHFDPVDEADAPLFAATVRLLHGSSLGRRWRALVELMQRGKERFERQRDASP